ncbi:nitric oxide reductase transcriptional regulator NorR [Pseudomonas lalucatii]|uniref:Nitric oxide reductase transcriptional regulator NorR n=1 Tax=Pseudomonas lalucatii TaxID=1424203 RepID=A0ABS5Q8G6_9PSED|nr:nitric oxide reductase transcriptional regulator NorR [Pseudomonas lalucatii]MBS7664441.1 nitric oxide reductase transcriptional regulator NorR [Pseudomonas lalucatii]MBS7725626.1 nitric oxide reductase transcriptional regulator NorR [Pseudomonas lalucatii]QVM88755.1 nitric oxide reductase transcriptional regulator NorR [Pseudomonas lalucatii]
MTANALLTALIPLVADLSRELPEAERYRRLLEALRQLLPCDAVALLRLDGEVLVPLAVEGLSADTLGRRFKLAEHPRLKALLERRGPTRFAADCGLPDPYDGLVEGHRGHLEVHDCLGCPLYLQDRPWGLLTLDALDPARFGSADLDSLEAFASLAAATVMASERINGLLRRVEDEHRLAEVYKRAADQHQARELIGQSAAHKRLLQEIALVGDSELTVLIGGETGAGKELVAEAIHAASPRAQRPLISLNCAALPDTLVESELFGHVRGAFSGALSERSGKFELADGGSLFLDEVGELPLAAQAKLLRVLQSGQLQRVGSDREHRVNVRVLAASNRDLAEEVRAGRFRADLYHRLSVYPLRVPALRERGRDVLLLAGYFLEENRARLGLRSLRLSGDAQKALLGHDWPGNVRELEHLIGRAALKALSACAERPRILSIDAAALDLPGHQDPAETAAPPPAQVPAGLPLRAAVDAYQKQLVGAALARHAHSWAEAARELGVDRANLLRLARRLGLR